MSQSSSPLGHPTEALSGGHSENIPEALPRSSVTSRALSILGTFERGREFQTLSQISRRIGLPVATTYRLIKELVAWDGLERRGSHYSIGRRVWELGHLAKVQRSIVEVARPYMQDVLLVTQNVVNLFVPDGGDVLLVERMSGSLVKIPFRRAGDTLSYNGSAGGKVLLAHAEDDTLEAALKNPVRHTEHTLMEREDILNECRLVREQGYAVSTEETGEGHFGLAVPVMLHHRVEAALGVVTLGKPAHAGTVVPVLRIAARAIARQLTRQAGSVE